MQMQIAVKVPSSEIQDKGQVRIGAVSPAIAAGSHQRRR